LKREANESGKDTGELALGVDVARQNQHPDLRAAGMRGVVDELLAALDSTLNRTKILATGLAGLLAGGLLLAAELPGLLEWPWSLLPVVATALAVIFVMGWLVALLTQMTVIEVSRFRPARWSEATAGLGRHALRLMMLYGVVAGGLVFALWALPRFLPMLVGQRVVEGVAGAEALLAVATILTLVLQVLLWPILGSTLLFGPIVVVEECSAWKALILWRALLHEHLGRVLLYEALALGVGTVITVPLLFPVFVAGWSSSPDTSSLAIAQGTLTILAALALIPLIAYLLVGNVFIYLNLRYDFTQARR
jgi:hypothetical protein